jgi:putative peptidoglycan lipid II flippase
MDNNVKRPNQTKIDHPKKRTAGMAIATILMIIGLTLSKSTGFLREIFIATRLGSPSVASEAFYLGFNIPDLFFQLLVGGSIQAAITPTLARSIETNEEKKGWRSVSIFISIISVVMLVVSILGSLFSKWLIPLVYFDKSQEITALGAKVSSALFPQVFFMMLAAFCIGILNANKKFSSTAFGPTIYNIFVVLSILILGSQSEQGVIFAAVGICVSALIYFLWQLFMARKDIKSFRFSLNFKDKGFNHLLRLAIPTMLSASIVQINTIIMTAFTGKPETGGFSEGIIQAMNWAKQLWMIPYGIFAVAVGSVMLPSLSGAFGAKDNSGAKKLLSKSLRNALFLTIPSAGLLFVLSRDVIPTVFNWGQKFSPEVAMFASNILMGYCIAIVAQTFVFIYNQAFYAIGNTKVPLLIGVLSTVIITSSCAVMKGMGLLSSNNQNGALLLSLAYSLSGVINAFVLVFLYKRNKNIAPRPIVPFLIRSLICLVSMMFFVLLIDLIPVHPDNKILELLWLATRAGIGFVTYLIPARLMRMSELQAFTDRFLKRGRK